MSSPFLIATEVIGFSALGAATAAAWASVRALRKQQLARSSQERIGKGSSQFRLEVQGQSDRKPATDVKARISIGDTNIEFTGDNVDDLMDVLSSWIESNRAIRSDAADEAKTEDSS